MMHFRDKTFIGSPKRDKRLKWRKGKRIKHYRKVVITQEAGK